MPNNVHTEQFSSIPSGTRSTGQLTLSQLRNLAVVLLCSLLVSSPIWAAEELGVTQAPVATTKTAAEPSHVGTPTTHDSADVKAPINVIRFVAETTVASANSVASAVTSAATVASNTVLDVANVVQHGIASWYGAQFHNKRTASGERFNMNDLTAAHRTLPFGTRVCAHSPATGKSVIVRINDRGPFIKDRVIDFSKAAAQALGILRSKPDVVALLDSSDKRCSTG